METKITVNPVWVDNIEAKCPDKDINEAFIADYVDTNATIGCCFGAYFGMLYCAKMCP